MVDEFSAIICNVNITDSISAKYIVEYPFCDFFSAFLFQTTHFDVFGEIAVIT